jgi:hypothetical protein
MAPLSSPRDLLATAVMSDQPEGAGRSYETSSPQRSPKNIQLPPSPPSEEQILPSPKQTRPAIPSRDSSFPSTPLPTAIASIQLPNRPRAPSPSRPQIRPQSSGGVPLMQRAHSSPGVDSSGRFITPFYSAPRRPTSPLHAGRRRSPLRSGMEESYPGTSSWIGLSIEPNIPEHEELEIITDDNSHPSPVPSYSTLPRSRRRPISLLHQSASAPSLQARALSPSTSRSTSPLLAAQKYANEPYPMYSFSSASSMPSTPTSLRSRSPSISSLETIEDIPDAEEAAMLEEEEGKQKDEEGGDIRRRSSLEIRGSNLRNNKERKRWSVCGAERRADFSLEPIEE